MAKTPTKRKSKATTPAKVYELTEAERVALERFCIAPISRDTKVSDG